MINPTSEWLHKHGLDMFGVSSVLGYYVYTVRGNEKRYEAAVDKHVYHRCKTDVQRRKLVYKAIEEAMDEH